MIYGVVVQTFNDGTEFLVVSARSENEAIGFAREMFDEKDVGEMYVDDLENLLAEQYNGLAALVMP